MLVPRAQEASAVVAELDRTLSRQVRRRRRRGLPPPQVLVEAPDWSFSSGDVDRPFHAASAGKLLTAALVAGLVERGRFGFDTPIGRLLPVVDTDGLPAVGGFDAAVDVTVDHLLAQTSGLPDFFDPPRGRRTPAAIGAVVAHPERRFTPSDLLDAARGLPAVGPPGERFHYSDTGWVLLGRIAEEATGEPFATLLRTRVFEPAGMEQAATPYDVTLLPDDLGSIDVEPFWLRGHELSRAHAVSLDWAGGNVVAPPRDWLRFLRALRGGVLVSESTLARLERPRHRFRRGIRYGAGTMTLRFDELVPVVGRGLPAAVGHLGVWATHVVAYPEHDAFVVLNFHADREMNASFQVQMRIASLLRRGAAQQARPSNRLAGVGDPREDRWS